MWTNTHADREVMKALVVYSILGKEKIVLMLIKFNIIDINYRVV